MIDDKTLAKIEKFIPKSYIKDLEDVIVYQNEDGSYELFSKYTIVKTATDDYTVYTGGTNDISFYSLKNAVAWCTYDKRNRLVDSDRIHYLDSGIVRVDAMMEQHQRLAKKANSSEAKLIYLAKLTEEKLRRKTMINEINSYVNQSKLWQTQRFNRKP
jgi:hypothetical protein